VNAQSFVPQNLRNNKNPVKKHISVSKPIFRVLHSNVKRGGGKMRGDKINPQDTMKQVIREVDLKNEISN